MNLTVDKLAKGVAGAIILIVLLVTVTRWWGDYRVAAVKASAPDATTTSTPTTPAPTEGEGSQEAAAPATQPQSQPSQLTAASGQTVIVLIEGLNFRKEADRGSKAIRALSKGEKLVLVKKIDSWYQVKDTDGEIGWISSNPAYAELEK